MPKPAVKWAVKRAKRTFTIDMLAAREQAAAGTLPPADRALIRRVLGIDLPPPAMMVPGLTNPEGLGVSNNNCNVCRRPGCDGIGKH